MKNNELLNRLNKKDRHNYASVVSGKIYVHYGCTSNYNIRLYLPGLTILLFSHADGHITLSTTTYAWQVKILPKFGKKRISQTLDCTLFLPSHV